MAFAVFEYNRCLYLWYESIDNRNCSLFQNTELLFDHKLRCARASNYVDLAIILSLKAAVKLREKTKINSKFLAAKGAYQSTEQSRNAHCFIYIWAFLTTRHIAQSHPPSVSSSFPASVLTWPRARRLCYVQPDVIPGSLVQQVNLTDNKCFSKMEHAPLGSLQLQRQQLMKRQVICLLCCTPELNIAYGPVTGIRVNTRHDDGSQAKGGVISASRLLFQLTPGLAEGNKACSCNNSN